MKSSVKHSYLQYTHIVYTINKKTTRSISAIAELSSLLMLNAFVSFFTINRKVKSVHKKMKKDERPYLKVLAD